MCANCVACIFTLFFPTTTPPLASLLIDYVPSQSGRLSPVHPLYTRMNTLQKKTLTTDTETFLRINTVTTNLRVGHASTVTDKGEMDQTR